MSLRKVTVNGRKVWQARVAFQGLRKSTIRPTKDEARTAEALLLGELQAEAGQAEAEGQQPATLGQLFEFYLSHLELHGKPTPRARCTQRAVQHLLPALLDRPVSKITDADLFEFRQVRLARAFKGTGRRGVLGTSRGRGARPATINRDLITLRAMLKLARPDYRFPGGAFLPGDNTRVRWLRPEEEILVFDTMPSPFREIAKLAALTLMRRAEVVNLRREYVHLEQGVIMLPRAKAGARPVILSAEAQKILRHELEGQGSAWVFPSPAGHPYGLDYVSAVFRRAARGAGLRDFHLHDLRHHGATMALNRGFTAPIVMALGGWKTEGMMRRYAAVTDQTLRAAAEAVSGNEVGHRPWIGAHSSNQN